MPESSVHGGKTEMCRHLGKSESNRPDRFIPNHGLAPPTGGVTTDRLSPQTIGIPQFVALLPAQNDRRQTDYGKETNKPKND